MKKKRTGTIAVTLGLASIVSLFNTGCHKNTTTMIVDGTIDCDEINVSSKVPGRIKQLFVDEGSTVKPGDPVVVLESNEIAIRL